MKKQFSTCLLIQGGSFAPELLNTEVNLHPGRGFFSDQEKTILIAGGFSSVTPESGFPLSPTLQLNYDLATFSSKELEAIAGAELQRVSAVDFRSLRVAADNRVAVIGDSAEQLLRFVDTYGGVLAIEPLLVKEYHPDFPTGLELTFESGGSGCRLEYRVRSPLDRDKCSYCGSCGSICPRQCISEDLFFNYSCCNFCRDCQAACDFQAIDIHSVLHTVLEVPAVIVLGEVEVELPEGTAGIYFENTLPEYFSTIFPSQIDEIISCSNSICQFSGRLGHGCDLCLTNCNHGAITRDGRGVTVDAGKCGECGACVAVCPTGALQNERFTDRMFVEYFQSVAIPADGTVVVGGEKALHRLWWRQRGRRREKVFFLQYDKTQSLNLFHYLHLFQRGARRIVVLFSEEDGSGTGMARKQLDLANLIIRRLYGIEDAAVVATGADFEALWKLPLVGSFGCAEKGRGVSFTHRRQALAFALLSLVKQSGRDPVMRPEQDVPDVPFATIQCDREKCTQCMACLNECRMEALRADRQQWTLNHLGALCVGCGICARVCPEKALKISSTVTLDRQFFVLSELARAEPMACRLCGKVFGTRKSYDRVMALLAEKEPVDTGHFELCATCRVLELFEVQH